MHAARAPHASRAARAAHHSNCARCSHSARVAITPARYVWVIEWLQLVWVGAVRGARAFAAIVVEVTAAREGGRRGWREEAKREVKAGVEAEVRRPVS